MRNSILAIMLMLSAVVVSTGQTQTKKYDIKSGIVTYETDMKMGQMDMKTKSIVYFDDYGIKECRETYVQDKLRDVFFSDGKELYVLKTDKKIALKRGEAVRGTEFRVDVSEFGTQKDHPDVVCKKLASTTIAGKTCKGFQCTGKDGTVTQYYGWDKILMALKLKTKNIESSQQAVKIEPNAIVPPEKFAVPAGYTIQ